MREDTLPLFRVTTFGQFALYRHCIHISAMEDVSNYEHIGEQVWRSRSAVASLLKLLLCRTRRRAPRDVLIEALWPDAPVSNANRSLDTALSLLRNLLRPEGKESLLTTIHQGATTIYQLPPQQLLWADVDAFLSQMAQAEQIEAQGGDPLPSFEAAWQIGSQVFLEDEIYCEWAQAKCQTVNMTRRHVLHRLADCYIQRDRPYRAEQLLLTAVEEEPADEDGSCRLMTLLEQQGRRQEALRCYERLVTALKEAGETEPLLATQACAQRLRAGAQPSSSACSIGPGAVEVDLHVSATPRGSAAPTFCTVTVPLTVEMASPQMVRASKQPEHRALVPERVVPSPVALQEQAGSNLLFYRIIKEICYWTGREGGLLPLQVSIDRLIKECDAMEQQRLPAEGLLSRREALLVIAGLPLGLLPKVQRGSTMPALLEEFLAQCTASMAICWHLLQGTEFRPVEALLSRYLPTLDTLAYQPSKYQKSIASLAAQGHFLAATLTLHQGNLLAREAHCKQAVQLSQLAEDVNLYVTALKWLAVTYYYAKRPLKSLHAYQKIEPLLDRVTPLLQGSVAIKMAGTYAQGGQEQEALRWIGVARDVFPEHPEQDPSFPYADCGKVTLPLWEGFAYLDLAQPKEAQRALERIEQLPAINVSERGRVEAITHLAEAAMLAENQELFRLYIERGVQGAKALGSEKRYNEALEVYQQAKKLWRHESKVKELQELFVR